MKNEQSNIEKESDTGFEDRNEEADNEESNSTNINDQDDETTDNPSTSMLDNVHPVFNNENEGKVYAAIWHQRTVIYLKVKSNGL